MSNAAFPILSLTASFRSLDGKKTLRGPRYVYPFGNFRHMFSESRALSYKWKKEYGHIYRIWTGLYSEGPFRWGFGYWMHSREEFQSAKEYLKTWKKWVETASESRKGQTDLPITKLWQEVEKGNLSKDELLQTLTESTVFNLEPTSHALLMTTLMVADDPKFQEELVAEFDSNRDDIPRYIGRKDTLLHYAFLEAMRVQPVLPFTLPEAASVDKELSGFKIPKGTSVVTSSFALNTNPEFWGADSTSFRPARFASVTTVELQRNLSMFGFGARKCLGQFFADKQLRAVVFHLFDRYKVTCSDYSTFEKCFKDDKTEYIDRFALEFMLQKRERA
ncbi:hypothetical protein M409DRAFT_71435 [Zasmidium cellare ATCC 36951]|uniref:Cytochrome P450 n=1 Tax=Zasmidium cellare ATCC 36951 TaxID=1080233 RepID=A0A6A6BYZ1_ZASCE|nr:uncharacterized protein M409DRAFT_71435 [Zasmidium cellare ATCC 36951]KAF2158802.1 hypothetical protein M409DRAFT_71435 [Zasmidium cellare ATCC 36951]